MFDKILDSCKHLFGGDELDVLLVDEQGLLQIAAYVGKARDIIAATFPAPVDMTPAGIAIRERRVVHWPDVLGDAPDVPKVLRRMGREVGYQSLAFAPMVWNDQGIGAIGVARSRGAFADKELAMLQTFADQAVIAIQNARMFRETHGGARAADGDGRHPARDQRVARRHPAGVQRHRRHRVPTLQGCDRHPADAGGRRLSHDGHRAARRAGQRPRPVAGATRCAGQLPVAGDLGKQVLHLPDWLAVDLPPHERQVHAGEGFRSSVMLPILQGDDCIGAFGIARRQPGEFNAKEIALLRAFVDQAVIAIHNVRLFNETREALERQTATADILQVISASVADPQPVFEKILVSCERLFGSNNLAVFLVGDDGLLHLAADARRRTSIASSARARSFPSRSAARRPNRRSANAAWSPTPTCCMTRTYPTAARRVAALYGENYSWRLRRCCGRSARSARSRSAARSCSPSRPKDRRCSAPSPTRP